jgi:hypothetical protein
MTNLAPIPREEYRDEYRDASCQFIRAGLTGFAPEAPRSVCELLAALSSRDRVARSGDEVAGSEVAPMRSAHSFAPLAFDRSVLFIP